MVEGRLEQGLRMHFLLLLQHIIRRSYWPIRTESIAGLSMLANGKVDFRVLAIRDGE